METYTNIALVESPRLSTTGTSFAGKVDSRDKLAAAIAAVAAYCRQRSSVEVADILASITDLSAAVLDAHVLPALLDDGTLKRTSQEDRCAVTRRWISCCSPSTHCCLQKHTEMPTKRVLFGWHHELSVAAVRVWPSAAQLRSRAEAVLIP